MFKYVIFLLGFHVMWVFLSYAMACFQDNEYDSKLMMNWVYFNSLVFLAWLPLYMKVLTL